MTELTVRINQETITAISWYNHQPVDIWHRRRTDTFQTGMVFLGRIISRNRQLGCAVDIGDAQPALLTARKCSGRRLPDEGAAVIVQIDRVSREDKGARVRMLLQLAGPHLVFTPFEHGLRPSRRLGKLPDSLRRSGLDRTNGGFVVRHHAAFVDLPVLEREAMRLMETWRWICDRATSLKPPALLTQSDDPSLSALMTDALGERMESIIPADHQTAATLRRVLHQIAPEAIDRLSPAQSDGDMAQICQELNETEVLYGNGGRIWIETTRAGTVIDVDGGRTLDPLAANIAAARTIVRQCRLRRIGGNIIIDFIDLPQKSDREALHAILLDIIHDDPAMIECLPMSRFGLVHMRRQYYGQDLQTFREDWETG